MRDLMYSTDRCFKYDEHEYVTWKDAGRICKNCFRREPVQVPDSQPIPKEESWEDQRFRENEELLKIHRRQNWLIVLFLVGILATQIPAVLNLILGGE
jgi:hypothetical protein